MEERLHTEEVQVRGVTYKSVGEGLATRPQPNSCILSKSHPIMDDELTDSASWSVPLSSPFPSYTAASPKILCSWESGVGRRKGWNLR